MNCVVADVALIGGPKRRALLRRCAKRAGRLVECDQTYATRLCRPVGTCRQGDRVTNRGLWRRGWTRWCQPVEPGAGDFENAGVPRAPARVGAL